MKKSIRNHNDPRTRFGKLLKMIRVDREMTMREMAILLNVDTSYVSLVEHGKRTTPVSWFPMLRNLFELTPEEDRVLASVESNKPSKLTRKEIMSMHSQYSSFGKVIRKILVDRNEGVAEAAKKMGFSASYMSSIIRGKTPVTLKVFNRICNYCSITGKERKKLETAAMEQIGTIKCDVSRCDKNVTLFLKNMAETINEEKEITSVQFRKMLDTFSV